MMSYYDTIPAPPPIMEVTFCAGCTRTYTLEEYERLPRVEGDDQDEEGNTLELRRCGCNTILAHAPTQDG
jgi:hypothetical protein